MENYSAFCDNLDFDKLLIEKDGKVELTEEGLKKASDFSEGNKYLYDVLTSCWKHKIKTFACCAGHEGPVNGENTNLFPYLGIMLDDNSLPYIKNIIGQLQNVKDVSIEAGFTLSEEEWGPDVPKRYKSFQIYCCLPNRCEVFYKIRKAIEESRERLELSSADEFGTSAEEFCDMVTDFQNKQFSDEEQKNFPRITYSHWPQELGELQYEKTKLQKFKEKVQRFFHVGKGKFPVERYMVAQNSYEPPITENSAYKGRIIPNKPQNSTLNLRDENIGRENPNRQGITKHDER